MPKHCLSDPREEFRILPLDCFPGMTITLYLGNNLGRPCILCLVLAFHFLCDYDCDSNQGNYRENGWNSYLHSLIEQSF